MKQNKDELVSVIIPVYNAGKFIDETIGSVRSQTYDCWELILVDDGSTDDGREKIEKWCEEDERIHLIVKERNEGVARARNTGIYNATGRYIAFLDADDIWRPEKLEKEMEFMKEKGAAFAFTAYEFADEDGYETNQWVAVPETLTYEKALSRTVIFTSTVLFDMTKISKDLIRMPEVPSEDTATWWKILRSGYTAYGLDKEYVVYRRPEGSLSSNKFLAIKRIWNLYRNVEDLPLDKSIWNFIWWAIRAVSRRIRWSM